MTWPTPDKPTAPYRCSVRDPYPCLRCLCVGGQLWSPLRLPDCQGGLSFEPERDARQRRVPRQGEYIDLVLSAAEDVSHVTAAAAPTVGGAGSHVGGAARELCGDAAQQLGLDCRCKLARSIVFHATRFIGIMLSCQLRCLHFKEEDFIVFALG